MKLKRALLQMALLGGLLYVLLAALGQWTGLSPGGKGDWITPFSKAFWSGPAFPTGTGAFLFSTLVAFLVRWLIGWPVGLWLRGRKGTVSRGLRFMGLLTFTVPVFLVAPVLLRRMGLSGSALYWWTGCLWALPLLADLAYRISDYPKDWSAGAVLFDGRRDALLAIGRDLPAMTGGFMAAFLRPPFGPGEWHLLFVAGVLSLALTVAGRHTEKLSAGRYREHLEVPSARPHSLTG